MKVYSDLNFKTGIIQRLVQKSGRLQTKSKETPGCDTCQTHLISETIETEDRMPALKYLKVVVIAKNTTTKLQIKIDNRYNKNKDFYQKIGNQPKPTFLFSLNLKYTRFIF